MPRPSMPTGWVKSMQCKSRPSDVHDPRSSLPRKPLLPLSSSCSSSSSSINDVVFLLPTKPPTAPRRRRPTKVTKPNVPPPSPPPVSSPPPFPTLTELPAGHSSRRVVEIIFTSSWSPNKPAPTIEILFRVHSPARTLSSFETHRTHVRAAAGGDARCAADGNEMMRFHCGGGDGGVYDAAVAQWPVRTFAASGAAHEAAGGGAGRRSMLVCRVIAGRVREKGEPASVGESVCRGPGELLVFDRRAVLPCFLIIYKVQ